MWSTVDIYFPYTCSQMFVIYNSLHDPGIRNMSVVTDRAVFMVLSVYFTVSIRALPARYSLTSSIGFAFMKVGLFGYITYCNEDVKGDVLANFSLDLISQLTRLGELL